MAVEGTKDGGPTREGIRWRRQGRRGGHQGPHGRVGSFTRQHVKSSVSLQRWATSGGLGGPCPEDRGGERHGLGREAVAGTDSVGHEGGTVQANPAATRPEVMDHAGRRVR